MAHSTRSRSSPSNPEPNMSLSVDEADTLYQRAVLKEKQNREQAELLASQQEELRREIENFRRERENVGPSELQRIQMTMDSFGEQIRLMRENSRITDLHSVTTQSTVPPYNAPPQRNDTASTLDLSPLRLKDVADSIPRYDGQRMSVFQFCQACERALKLIPPHQELHLVQLIMGRLQGHAYTIMQDSDYSTIAPLLRKLKKIFGLNKSLNQYRGELGNLYMKPSESILDYITRVKEIQTAIMDCEAEQKNGLDNCDRGNIEKDVLVSFINGLPSELLIRLKIDGYEDLDDAFARAIQLSKTLEVESSRKRSAYAPPPSKLPRRDPPQPVYNHQKFRPPFIKPLIPGQAGPNAPGQIICFYCKTPGHYMSDCRKRIFNEQQKVRFNVPEPIAPVVQVKQPGNETRIPIETRVLRDTTETGRSNVLNANELDSPMSPEPQ